MNDKNIRWWDATAAFLLIVVIMTVATRLNATGWTSNLERIQYLALLGVIFGIALGQSSFSPRVVKWLTVAYGLFFIPWQLGLSMADSLSWNERVSALGSRLGLTLWQFLHRESVQDPILFLTLMAVLFWVLSTSAGYFFTRYGQPWPSILPAGIGLYIINHYDPGLSTWARYMGIYLFAALLYLGRMTYLRYRSEWRRARVLLSPETGMIIGRAGLLAVVVLVLFAWNVPVLAQAFGPASQLWVQVSKPWESIRERASNAFSALKSSVGVVSDFYGPDLSLGTGTLLGNQVVFTVKASDPPPQGTHYYWRARSYDTYKDGQWTSSAKQDEPIGPSANPLTYPGWKGRQEISFTFTSNVTLLSTIYTAPTPIWVNVPGQAVVNIAPGGQVDVERLSANPPLHAGQVYTVRAWVTAATADELRTSDQNYPALIRDTYLQLPADLPPDIAQLARQITNGLTNPYDKAQAITEYLRANIQYAPTIPQPPRGQDPLEWFLFTEKQGFCNYYASAEVIMLRTLGIPARLAVGFAQGEVDAQTQLYTVRNQDGHAWPEVYFNGYGWIEFEPTASQPAIQLVSLQGGQLPSVGGNLNRLQELNQQDFPRGPFHNESNNTTQSAAQRLQTITRWLLIIPALMLLAGLILGWRYAVRRYNIQPFPVLVEAALEKRGIEAPKWLKRWSRFTRLSPLERAFTAVNRALWLLGSPAEASLTPAERVEMLNQLLPSAAPDANALLQEYQRTLYSPQPGDLDLARQASRRVRRHSYLAFLRRMVVRPARNRPILRQPV